MKILISLPIYQREWILPEWLKCIESQTVPLKNIGFQFELGPDDEETHNILWDWHQKNPEVFLFDAQVNSGEKHFHHIEGQRAWKRDEYLRMVSFRNNLLEKACERINKFDRYFSLDSDILLSNPNTLEILANHNKDVVSPLMYMTPTGTDYPNSMDWSHNTSKPFSAKRNKLGKGLTKINVPMAAVMMKPKVVKNTRYIWHPQGEDIGFATQLHINGYSSYIDYDIYTPHIMHRSNLIDYMKNGDSRGR